MTLVPASITLIGHINLAVPIASAFRLFSPLGEKMWVPGWDPELLFPPNVEWQEGQLFRTREESGEAIWIVSKLDLKESCVVYHRIEPGRYVARIKVHCDQETDRSTDVTIVYSFVGLSAIGNQEIAAMSQGEFDEKMKRWTGWLKTHLQERHKKEYSYDT